MTHRAFKKTLNVQKKDCSTYGLIRYENYFEWINKAQEDFLNKSGCGKKHFIAKNCILAVVSVNLTCMSPCLAGDKIALHTKLDRVTEHSVYFSFTAVRAKTMDTVFKASKQLFTLDKEGRPVNFDDEDYMKLKANITPEI